jgi:hypothetical protein
MPRSKKATPLLKRRPVTIPEAEIHGVKKARASKLQREKLAKEGFKSENEKVFKWVCEFCAFVLVLTSRHTVVSLNLVALKGIHQLWCVS